MKKRILLVDDEPDFTHLLRLNLEAIGPYEVREINDSQAVLNAAYDFGPHAIVLDMMMSGADGGAVAARLNNDAQLRRTPFVFVTALVSEEQVCPPSLGMGRRTYLPKPLDMGRLVAWIERHVPDAAPA